MDKDQKPKLTLKRRVWLRHYLKSFNATEAARVAGYRCKKPDGFETIGYQNARKLQPVIARWIEQVGLTPERIKAKIIQGMHAKETKFFSHEGKVTDQREVEAWGIQARFTELAAKVLHMYKEEPKPGDQQGQEFSNLETAARLFYLIGEALKRKDAEGSVCQD